MTVRRNSAAPLIIAAVLYAATTACLAAGVAPPGIDAVEQTYQQARSLKDAINTLRAGNRVRDSNATPLSGLLEHYAQARALLLSEFRDLDDSSLTPEDRHAAEIMGRAVENQLVAEPDGSEQESDAGAPMSVPDCDYDPAAIAKSGVAALSERMYACFGAAAGRLTLAGETLDRLTVLARLATTPDEEQRRKLFLALEPVWTMVNGADEPDSPWRTLIRLSAARLKETNSSIETGAALLGVDPARVEPWLVSVLEAWRDATAGMDLEPWDFAHAAGAMDRALAPHLPLTSLRPLNDLVYRDLGADPMQLGIEYDIAPRAGKDPVAYTDFAARPRRAPGGAWTQGRYRISASYSSGGAGNLAELLHETGHAIHIAAIRTRPAFTDWPDSDTFTEALADLVALDLYDPRWQQHYLDASVPAADARRAKYASIVMDTTWALFEIRMLRDPALDPDTVWTDLTRNYLHIRPHPEWSWWAMRGQLVHQPGYMLNYALGAILIADLRARTRELFGDQPWGDTTWYGRVAERLFRFGLERPSRQVIEDYLGRTISPDALLRDLRGE